MAGRSKLALGWGAGSKARGVRLGSGRESKCLRRLTNSMIGGMKGESPGGAAALRRPSSLFVLLTRLTRLTRLTSLTRE